MEPLIVPGALESLEAITAFVTETAAAAAVNEEASYRLRLAVDEITTNIITHGYVAAGIQGALELWADIDEKSVTIYIEDKGQTYNPLQYQRPDDLDRPLDQRQVGGLGVYLAMQSVDKFAYEHVGDRNRHTLVVRR
jgi:serine/threonine-protein kinase RsbW